METMRDDSEMLRSFVAKTVSGHDEQCVASGNRGLRYGLGDGRKYGHDVHGPPTSCSRSTHS
jgi:hypothetical protein